MHNFYKQSKWKSFLLGSQCHGNRSSVLIAWQRVGNHLGVSKAYFNHPYMVQPWSGREGLIRVHIFPPFISVGFGSAACICRMMPVEINCPAIDFTLGKDDAGCRAGTGSGGMWECWEAASGTNSHSDSKMWDDSFVTEHLSLVPSHWEMLGSGHRSIA